MKINWIEVVFGAIAGEAGEGLFRKFVQEKGEGSDKGKKDGPKLEKSNILGWGKEDERLFWKAVEMASKPVFNKSGELDLFENMASIAELRVVTDFSGMTHAHKRALILYVGHKEDVVQVSEEKKNADGTPFDPAKNVGKKGGGGGQPAKVVVTQKVANTDGRQKIIWLVNIMRDELNYTYKKIPKTFTPAQKTKAKKAIEEWLIKSGLLRDLSDQVEESVKELEQTALVVANRLGFKHETAEELQESIDNWFQKSELALAQAKARAK